MHRPRSAALLVDKNAQKHTRLDLSSVESLPSDLLSMSSSGPLVKDCGTSRGGSGMCD